MSQPEQTDPVRPAGQPWQRWSVVLPTLTFLVGGALGAAVVGAGSAAPADSQDPVVAASAPPTPSPSPELVVRVPDACVQVAAAAALAYDILDQAVVAARDLDARRLGELVDQVQDEQTRTRVLIDTCREQSADSITQPSATTVPSAVPTR